MRNNDNLFQDLVPVRFVFRDSDHRGQCLCRYSHFVFLRSVTQIIECLYSILYLHYRCAHLLHLECVHAILTAFQLTPIRIQPDSA